MCIKRVKIIFIVQSLSSLYADSDDDVTIIQSIFKGIVGRMPGFNEIMTKYELEMDEDIVFYPIPTRVITTVLIFLVPSKVNIYYNAQQGITLLTFRKTNLTLLLFAESYRT